MNPIIDADKLVPEQFQPMSFNARHEPKKPAMKMVFHFSRVIDSDIHVEGADFGDCVRKAIEQRMAMCTPTKIQGEVE